MFAGYYGEKNPKDFSTLNNLLSIANIKSTRIVLKKHLN